LLLLLLLLLLLRQVPHNAAASANEAAAAPQEDLAVAVAPQEDIAVATQEQEHQVRARCWSCVAPGLTVEEPALLLGMSARVAFVLTLFSCGLSVSG
jgi:hypothetical protein